MVRAEGSGWAGFSSRLVSGEKRKFHCNLFRQALIKLNEEFGLPEGTYYAYTEFTIGVAVCVVQMYALTDESHRGAERWFLTIGALIILIESISLVLLTFHSGEFRVHLSNVIRLACGYWFAYAPFLVNLVLLLSSDNMVYRWPNMMEAMHGGDGFMEVAVKYFARLGPVITTLYKIKDLQDYRQAHTYKRALRAFGKDRRRKRAGRDAVLPQARFESWEDSSPPLPRVLGYPAFAAALAFTIYVLYQVWAPNHCREGMMVDAALRDDNGNAFSGIDGCMREAFPLFVPHVSNKCSCFWYQASGWENVSGGSGRSAGLSLRLFKDYAEDPMHIIQVKNMSGFNASHAQNVVATFPYMFLLELERLELEEFAPFLQADPLRAKQMMYLSLAYNKLHGLVLYTEQFPTLLDLKLESNRLGPALHASVGQLTSLIELRAGSNKLEDFGASFGSLERLIYLDASSNDISAVTPGIQNLPNVRRLLLQNNSLRDVDIASVASAMPGLAELQVQYNAEISSLDPLSALSGLMFIDAGHTQVGTSSWLPAATSESQIFLDASPVCSGGAAANASVASVGFAGGPTATTTEAFRCSPCCCLVPRAWEPKDKPCVVSRPAHEGGPCACRPIAPSCRIDQSTCADRGQRRRKKK